MDMSQPNNDVLLMIGRMDGKLDAIISSINNHEAEIKDHDARISKLEQYKAWLLGASAAMGAGSSYLISFIKGH